MTNPESDPNQLKIKLLDSRAKVPLQKLNSNGYDLYPLENILVFPGDTMWVDTGIALAPPPGHYIRVAMRSGYSGKGLIAGAGIVDWNYRGPLKVCIHNVAKDSSFGIHLNPNIAFAQFVVERCANPPIKVVDTLDDTERGARGFGSTDQTSLQLDNNYLFKY